MFVSLEKGFEGKAESKIIGREVLGQSNDSLMLALEPRMLFDAAGLVAGLDLLPEPEVMDPGFDPVLENTDIQPDADLFSNIPAVPAIGFPAVESVSSIVFVDSGVEDYESLINDVASDTLVIMLESDSDGVTQIGDILSQYEDVASVHIISHGSSASITLGDAVLSQDTLENYSTDLSVWGDSLTQGADILIYGCNVAEGVEGQTFVAQLSDMTGADVAASDDVTGTAAHGGDWDLETRTGIIESNVAASELGQHSYTGTLADIVVTEAGDNRDVATNGVDDTNGYNLREALEIAAYNDTILFDTALAGTTNSLNYGVLDISNNVSINGDIDGDGNFDITVDAQGNSRVFQLGKIDSTLTGLYIKGGYHATRGGGIYNDYGNLTLNDCIVSSNSSGDIGGGVYSYGGLLKIYDSIISNNDAANRGGGIYNFGTAIVSNSTISDNATTGNGEGGGVFNLSNLTITNSTISDNDAYEGGGIYNYDNLKINSSTISGNYAYNGGGIFDEGKSGSTKINNSTISGNQGGCEGGGIVNNDGILRLYHSTLSGNTGKEGIDLSANTYTWIGHTIVNDSVSTSGSYFYSQGYNLFSEASITGSVASDLLGATADLDPLADNGGPTKTHTLGNDSDGFEAGDNTASTISTYDQRGTGFTRVLDTIDIGAVEMTNRPPNAVDDNFSTDEATAFDTGSVLANDMDLDSDTLSVSNLDNTGTKGTVSDNGDGTIYYDPNGQFDSLSAGDTTTDTFTYTVSDGNGFSDTAIVTITINGLNDDPTAVDDKYTTDQDTAITTGDVLVNDSDPNTDPVSLDSIDTTATKGLVTDNGDGTFDYDPNGQFDYLAIGESAADTFDYTISDGNGGTDIATVTIEVTGTNDPVTANDDTGSTDKTTVITTGSVLANDTDPDTSDTLTVAGMDTTCTKGSVTNNGDGTFDYDPNGQFNSLGALDTATDTFAYTVSDGNGSTDTATVTITAYGGNGPPTGNDDGFSTDEDTAFTTADALSNDTDPNGADILSVDSINTTGTKGTVTDNGDGTFNYDPSGQFDYLAAGESATDTFDYTVSDGNGETDTAQVTITVTGSNDPLTANDDTGSTDKNTAITTGNVLTNDTDPDTSDTLTVTGIDTTGTKGGVINNGDGTFDYDPNGQFASLTAGSTDTDTFTYTVSDGNGSTDTATVTITVSGGTVSGGGGGSGSSGGGNNDDGGDTNSNTRPEGGDDTVTGGENSTFTFDVLSNDADGDSDNLTITGFDASDTLGLVTDNGDGTFTYDPNGQFDDLGVGETAQDTFTYTVSDGNGGTDTVTVTITITGTTRSATGLVFNTPTADASFGDLITDTQRSGTPWYQIWTGNEAGTEGAYVDTGAFYENGNGWIQGDDLSSLFPDYCQADDAALWVRSWTQAGGYGNWASSAMPFNLIDSVNACDSATGPVPVDQMFNDENASSGHWYRIWVGDGASEETSGSFLDTSLLNNGASQGWARASELALLSFTPDEPGASQELWVRAWSPEAGNLGWEHWTVTCTEGTETAAVMESRFDFSVQSEVESGNHWQQAVAKTIESDIPANEAMPGFNEQIQVAGTQFEIQRREFLERLCA